MDLISQQRHNTPPSPLCSSYRIGEAEKLPSLPDMTDATTDSAVKAKLDAANARFVAFLIDEKPARRAAGLR